MSENDYIAEYVKVKYPNILGVEFAIWKMQKQMVNAVKPLCDFLGSLSKEELIKTMSEDESEESEDDE